MNLLFVGNQRWKTKYFYDYTSGQRNQQVDPEGHVTWYQYDVLNRLIKIKDSLKLETHFLYDDRDNLIQVTDAKGNKTKFQ